MWTIQRSAQERWEVRDKTSRKHWKWNNEGLNSNYQTKEKKHKHISINAGCSCSSVSAGCHQRWYKKKRTMNDGRRGSEFNTSASRWIAANTKRRWWCTTMLCWEAAASQKWASVSSIYLVLDQKKKQNTCLSGNWAHFRRRVTVPLQHNTGPRIHGFPLLLIHFRAHKLQPLLFRTADMIWVGTSCFSLPLFAAVSMEQLPHALNAEDGADAWKTHEEAFYTWPCRLLLLLDVL